MSLPCGHEQKNDLLDNKMRNNNPMNELEIEYDDQD